MPYFVSQAQVADDAALLKRIALGDMQALARLYRRESDRIWRYCLAISRDEQVASDALQDTFVALAQSACAQLPLGFDPQRGNLTGYLLGTARHHVLAALREMSRHFSRDGLDDEDGPPTELVTDAHLALDPLRLCVHRCDHAQLMVAVSNLPFVFREVVVLVDLQEMSYDEAAQIAGVPLNTVRTRLHRGRLKLAKALGASLPTVDSSTAPTQSPSSTPLGMRP